MNNLTIKKTAVLGAGIMGTQIAALLANSGLQVLLLDLPFGEPGSLNRNTLVKQGIETVKKMNPPAFFLPELFSRIQIGNFEDDLGKLQDKDWILEAVVEKIEIKRNLLRKIETVRKKESIISTNTSGIPISDISKDFSKEFQSHFLGSHFFNPPRYLKLLELIPGPDTLPEVVQFFKNFAVKRLGKGVITAKDTPGFIANRIGTFAVCFILKTMMEYELTVEEVDEITGSVMGRPKSATFRTLDLVGLDTFAHVAQNLHDALPHDEMRDYFKIPEFVQRLIEKNRLGEKTKEGFYKKIEIQNGMTEIYSMDLKTLEYKPRRAAQFPSLQLAKTQDTLENKIKFLALGKDKASDFFWKITTALVDYAVKRIPEITDDSADIDQSMKWGFGWKIGPFELWDMLANIKGTPAVQDKLPTKKEKETKDDFIFLSLIKQNKTSLIKQNTGASLIHLGDGILNLEFHSKMNTIGEDVLTMMDEALKTLNQYNGLVIGNQGENFCIGANLMLILMLAEEQEWDDLEEAVDRFQKINQKIKYAAKPIVSAPFGRTLGGGCEIVLHTSKSAAAAETYIGLVEIGAGLVPAGGGLKEMISRFSQKFSSLPLIEPFKPMQQIFETIGFAKVSGSALEGKKLGYLRETDSIAVNSDFLLSEAKKTCLNMIEEGYISLEPQPVLVYGKQLYSNFLVGINLLKEGGKITEYEVYLAKRLAAILSGGDFTSPQWIPESHLLALEKETFLSLCGEKKTQERMQYLLKHGKPLRN